MSHLPHSPSKTTVKHCILLEVARCAHRAGWVKMTMETNARTKNVQGFHFDGNPKTTVNNSFWRMNKNLEQNVEQNVEQGMLNNTGSCSASFSKSKMLNKKVEHTAMCLICSGFCSMFVCFSSNEKIYQTPTQSSGWH